MQQIINFFLRNKNTVLFLSLFCIALFLTIQSHSYHKSKFITSANFLTGGIYESLNSINHYFGLKEDNKILLEENNRLKETIYNSGDKKNQSSYQFKVISGQVVKNSYSNSNNYLLVNKGIKDSVYQDQGVISAKGIVGIVDKASNGYARVLSILNTKSKINAQLKKTNHFGILTWDGISPDLVQLVDLPKQAPVKVGDTIITGGRSLIFPKGILIGQVESYVMDSTENYLTLQIRLFNDMTNIGYIHVISNQHRKEILTLEQINNE